MQEGEISRRVSQPKKPQARTCVSLRQVREQTSAKVEIQKRRSPASVLRNLRETSALSPVRGPRPQNSTGTRPVVFTLQYLLVPLRRSSTFPAYDLVSKDDGSFEENRRELPRLAFASPWATAKKFNDGYGPSLRAFSTGNRHPRLAPGPVVSSLRISHSIAADIYPDFMNGCSYISPRAVRRIPRPVSPFSRAMPLV